MQVKLIVAQGAEKSGSVVEVSDKHGALLIEVGAAEAVKAAPTKKKED